MTVLLTGNQFTYIRSLVQDRLGTLGFENVDAALGAMHLANVSKHDAGVLINRLKDMPVDPDHTMPDFVRTAPKRGRNSWAGKCSQCEWEVLSGQGWYYGTNGAWKMVHKMGECNPEPPPVEQELEDRRIYTLEDDDGSLIFARVKRSQAGNQYIMSARQGQRGWSYDPSLMTRVKREGRLLELEQAAQYGLQTGVCLICDRELTTEESVSRGIGPVCIKQFM